MYQPGRKDRMVEFEVEKRSLINFLDRSPESLTLRLHPSLSDLYGTKIRSLLSVLQDPRLEIEATEAPRRLISEIRMIPNECAPNGHHIDALGNRPAT